MMFLLSFTICMSLQPCRLVLTAACLHCLSVVPIMYAGRFRHATSPAGKASRHLSGCGSQPELPQHTFAHFAAGKLSTSHPSSRPASSPTPDEIDSPLAGADSNSSAALSNLLARSCEPDQTDGPAPRANSSCSAALANLLARSRMSTHTDVPAAAAGISNNTSQSGRLARSHTPEQTDNPAATAGSVNDLASSNRIQHAFNILAAGKSSALASSSRLADRHTTDQSDSPAAATNSQAAELAKAEQSPAGGGSGDDAEGHIVQSRADVGDAACASASADFYSTSPGGLESGDSPPAAELPSSNTSSPFEQGRVPSGHLVSPFKDASRASWEQQCSLDRPARRKVSAHFGSLPKRPKSVEADALPSNVNPFGVLAGLVSKLKPQSPPSELDSSTNEDFDIDLETNEDGTDDCMQEEEEEGAGVDRDASSMEEQNVASSMHNDPIAGLKHIQPLQALPMWLLTMSKLPLCRSLACGHRSQLRNGMTVLCCNPLHHRGAAMLLRWCNSKLQAANAKLLASLLPCSTLFAMSVTMNLCLLDNSCVIA